MAWHRTGDKPLSEPIVVWFSDIYLCCLVDVSQPKNVPLTEGISWRLTKTINCLYTSASPQGSTSGMRHGYWSLHHTHRPLLNATERYFVWPLTQASWSLANCGWGLFITSLGGGQLSQTPMVLGCSSVMGSWLYVIFCGIDLLYNASWGLAHIHAIDCIHLEKKQGISHLSSHLGYMQVYINMIIDQMAITHWLNIRLLVVTV